MCDAPLEIITLGHPVLRQMAQPVEHIHAPEIQQLIDQLIALADHSNGVGIAASQVGIPLQIMIIASHPTPRYPAAPSMPPTALINPQIVACSDAIDVDWEGCLSVPNCRAQVPRHRDVTVVYRDRTGAERTIEFTGFIARIFQHEYDHFQGIVFPDRIQTPESMVSEAVYQQILANAAPSTPNS
ncbi:peptide deformylase [filamentous cyanobacterium LEGE 11480]|uniref:Peptide deformylase n=2 Tax=Romeriopsis TaxID=2992131 RepID=A0A928VNJ5_9CYAN|nr:peptide deformylase [Romeriopsis navalis LEGE 11480]